MPKDAAIEKPESPTIIEKVSVVLPARDEELAIGQCLDSLKEQPEIDEIIVVDDQSRDRTADLVRRRTVTEPRLRLFQTSGVPDGWIGKNNAAALGAKEASQAWLLFIDADVELVPGACARALEIARESEAALVSFSPEQVTKNWYEKALIPFIYCRLARRFSYEAVNDPTSRTAAANGQFLMIRRDAYDAIGGHAGVAGDILEDVALAKKTKAAGFGLRFGPGKGIVRARMYRSFAAMWQGWRKNLYRLIGGTPAAVFMELESTFPWIPFLVILIGIKLPFALFAGVILLILRQVRYGSELSRNHYPFPLILYYVPAVLLYTGVLVASYRAYSKGKLRWKGREVTVGEADPTPAR
jgi:glycosyltransferase involved in cell wall biosynthesis